MRCTGSQGAALSEYNVSMAAHQSIDSGDVAIVVSIGTAERLCLNQTRRNTVAVVGKCS